MGRLSDDKHPRGFCVPFSSSGKTTQNRLPIGFLSDYLLSGITAILCGSSAFRSILWQNNCFFAVKHYHLRKNRFCFADNNTDLNICTCWKV